MKEISRGQCPLQPTHPSPFISTTTNTSPNHAHLSTQPPTFGSYICGNACDCTCVCVCVCVYECVSDNVYPDLPLIWQVMRIVRFEITNARPFAVEKNWPFYETVIKRTLGFDEPPATNLYVVIGVEGMTMRNGIRHSHAGPMLVSLILGCCKIIKSITMFRETDFHRRFFPDISEM